MLNRQSHFAYQAAAASGATEAGLVQLVYSHLAQDLLRAAAAARRGDIEERCHASSHGLLLLAHLESWLESTTERQLADSLRSFYQLLRAALLQMQASPEAESFERLAQLVLDTRSAWQTMEARALASSLPHSSPAVEVGTEALSFHA